MNCSTCENKLPEVLPHTYGSCLKCKGVKDERARWVAAVGELMEVIDFHQPGLSKYETGLCYGGKEKLEELLAKMEATQ